MIKHAYSTFEIKAFDESARTFEGIASTPTPDRMGDIVEPKGAKYQLPIALKWQHGKGDIKDPVGWVDSVSVRDNQIHVKGRFAQLNEPPSLKEDLDRVWALVKSKLVRGLSIGFRPLKSDPIKGSFAERFTSWEWLELSAVDIPANAEASILTIKSFDREARGLSARERGVVTLDPSQQSGVPAQRPTKGKTMAKKSVAEQIVDFSSLLTAKQARIDELIELASEGVRTLTAEEKEEHETLKGEIKEINEHITILKDHEANLIARAAAVGSTSATSASAATTQGETAITRRAPIEVKSMQPKGVLPARMAIAMYKGGNVPEMAAQIAKRLWPDSPEVELVLRAAVDAGDTTTSGWASQLVPAAQQMMNEFLELLRPATILGRIPGMRRVPFNIAIPIETASGTVGWVGEGAGKPVGALTFTSATLRWAKAAGIVVITEELARFSQPSADMIIRDSMIKTLGRFFDTQFVGTQAEVSNVSPAGILNGISATSTSGTTATALRTDLATLIGKFITNNQDPSSLVLLMSATQAMKIGLITTDLGIKVFPSVGVSGGSLEGFPVIVSENVGTKIIALNANEILIAEDNGVRVDVSREASVEMESTPAVGEQSPITTLGPLKSLWQNNLVGFRVERYITWKRGRDSAVEYLNAVNYAAS